MFKENKEGQTNFCVACEYESRGEVRACPHTCGMVKDETIMFGWKKCSKCLAHYQEYHQCFDLMKMLVDFNKKKK